MKTIPVSNSNKFIVVDDEDFTRMSAYKWYFHLDKNGNGRITTKVNGVTRSPVALVMNNLEALFDHKDRDIFNNQKLNLRLASFSENSINRAKYITESTTSRFKGVSFCSRSKKWRAQIQKDKKTISLGYFLNEEEAATAYNNAAIQLFGNFAVLNDYVT